ncbi:pyrimidine-nucleoside phosphorylase [hydrocarbon metagenome]|uniref:Pyrimidine-nucleoside phosphorylase n=1 Tax=hydrocarbon metagenome TaxID=938273 RepID=A0A0W8FWM9_9ZZZZ
MNVVSLIRKKRDGKALTIDEIGFLVNGYVEGKVTDYQFAAFLMAAYLRGLNKWETSALTSVMLFSGKVLDLSSIEGFKIDKHSTGGVGDKTSLILAPIAAAAGVKVPMISGRGLGHTGGTLDKLESIPGFRTDLDLDEFISVINSCGTVLIGQTKDIAPADKLIYALRDVTATVESIPLITGSIMSKKLAAGIDGLVLDVKTGSGAFMKSLDDSIALAKSLIDTAKSFNKKVMAFITDMNQPLGNYVGNFLEVYESVKVLQGKEVEDLKTLSVTLSGAMIYLGGKAESVEEGIEISNDLIKNGKAFDKFVEITKAQGGDVKYLQNPESYPKSKHKEVIYAEKEGYLKSVDTYEIGMAALELGAGRQTLHDKIDFKAGLIFYPKISDKINKGDKLVELFTDKEDKIESAKQMITGALEFTDKKVEKPALIKKVLD